MPRVPTYDALQVGANVLPAARVSAPQLPDFAGQQAQQFSQATGNLAASTGRIAADMTQQANQLRIDDALNQAKEAALKLTFDKDEGFSGLAGINALERPDGKPLADEYGGRLQSRLDEIAGTLGNDAQRRAFAQQAGGILANFRGQAIKHEASEYKTYALSVTEGIQATAMRDIAMNWNNPDAINAAVHRVQAQVYRQAQLSGMSAEWQEMQSRKLTSVAHKTALVAALQNNDPAYAGAYLTRYASQMDADDILAVRGTITKEMDSRTGLAAATDAMRKHPIATSDTERAFNILLGTESGNRQFDADGNPLTSSAGAVGIAQVMPETAKAAAKRAGMAWDEDRYQNDPDYNRALGLSEFQYQLQSFGGDLAKAYAAYNAGPGWVKKAEAAAAKAEPGTQEADWLWQLNNDGRSAENRKQTQDYVAKNMRQFNAGQGQAKRPTLAQVEADLQNDPRLAGNPERLKIARVEAERQYKVQTEAIKAAGEESVATALRGLYENGGSFSELPVSIRASIPPDQLTTVMNAAERIAKGDDTTSLWLYNRLTNSPDDLAAMSDDQFYALRISLSEADFKHFSQERAKRTGAAPGANGPGDLNSQAIKSGLDTRLNMMGEDPTPKDKSSEAERVGAMRKFIDGYFIAAQREAGKKFNDAEVEQHLDALFMRNATVRAWFSWLPGMDGTSSVPILSMSAGDIPSAEKDAIKAAFKRAGIDKPNDAQILDLYWQGQIKR